MNKKSFILFSVITLISMNQSIYSGYLPCSMQPQKLKERSLELKRLAEQDQEDRKASEIPPEEWEKISKRDAKRRKRVGEIFGEGCFHVGEDYNHAALIYQHGDNPDHFYQAFIWSIKASELGVVDAKQFSALAIDRYLNSIGKKQLFGSQAMKINGCFCMVPVESTFPDATRQNYAGFTLKDKYNWIASLNEDKNCSNTECDLNLLDSAQGTIPGFW
ncbi:TPA: hypothetical protein I8034_000467 [Legionella pneumophila]|nr:hypothetical protein [Legionella pneumophila]MDW9166792.1 hypothetical protein [Legionella pneumophila subsp. fraseri]MDX1845549.1 hypothetical protein [Legionella pneumophila subsp. fraseri]HAT1659748.1 hypothetical protein [Legionella pneumophila]HAT1771130.1 hypothetical protein [Legionella pneumophila]HAT1884109.1 hypothetical protein [Legionella pneumophila]